MRREQKLAQLFIQQEKTLATAESCTGGLLAKRLTEIPGSSNFFTGGLVTYSNDAKKNLLKISSKKLNQHGAVSEPVAIAMAENVRKRLKTDFGIGITGIAGPEGGSKTKPVGLVFIAVSTKTEILCLKFHFSGSRSSIRQQASDWALELLLEFFN